MSIPREESQVLFDPVRGDWWVIGIPFQLKLAPVVYKANSASVAVHHYVSVRNPTVIA